jgi:alkanesulfonate monooxygenase SsuD/methylene tetrahydromethanopterin reductase-like flavin-dependent oxidoreductase (luciferase family)
VVTVDQLSGGRVILTVGLGAIATDLPDTGEAMDLRQRADMLDKGIDLIRELWAGRQHFGGDHYTYACEREDLCRGGPAGSVAHPDLGGRRVAATEVDATGAAVRRRGAAAERRRAGAGQLADLRRWLAEHEAAHIDVVAKGETSHEDGERAASTVRPWQEAGATWWLETRWEMPHNSPERMRQITDRIAAGPPAAL